MLVMCVFCMFEAGATCGTTSLMRVNLARPPRRCLRCPCPQQKQASAGLGGSALACGFPPIQLPGQPRQPFGILLRLRICRMGTPAIGILLPLRRPRGPRWCISSIWYQGSQGSGSPLLKSGPRKKYLVCMQFSRRPML